MEYGLYLAFVVLVLALCVYKVRKLGKESREEQTRKAGGDAAGAGSAEISATSDPLRRRELRDVPVPWGWPGSARIGSVQHEIGGHGTGVHAPSGALHRWVDRLVAEKQTIDDSGYRERREASMRALLEDRFHSAGHPAVQGRPGTNGKGGGPAGNGAKTNGHSAADAGIEVKIATKRDQAVSGIRTPWGW